MERVVTNAAPSRRARILVVDDEPRNCRLLDALLRPEGYSVVIATTGEQALAAVAAVPPDLILLDVMMPGMDGYEVARTLKSDPATANIPIIMLSALADRDARVSGLNAGAEDFLTKPVDKGELWLRVRNLLRLKELSDRLLGHSVALEQQVQARTADLHQLAHYDALTCVPNRAFLHETLRKTLPIAAAKGWTVAVMFLDIDHFKVVNDTLGHSVGDELLAQFSARLVESVRVRDTVGRLGGDEFALIVLLEAGEPDGAAIVAAKIGRALQEPFHLQGREATISASIGITVYPDDGADADTLLRNADTAMYRAKEGGRDTFRFYTTTMNDQVTAHLQVEAASRQAAKCTGALALTLLDDMDAPTCAVDGNGLITALNRAWREATSTVAGVPTGASIGASYLDVFSTHHHGDADALRRGVHQVLQGENDRFETAYSRGEGDLQRWFTLVVFPLGEGAGAVMSHLDVTDVHRGRENLELQGLQDPLTKLPNRERALEVLHEMSDPDAPEHRPLAAACIGVDGLKHINDGFGYAAGDELLQGIADRVRLVLRHGDTLARFTGDEFVVIWPGVASETEARELAQRLAAAFDAPFRLAAGTVAVSASVGVALAGPTQSGEDLLLAATAAMRDGKRRGPGRTSVYTSGLVQGAGSRVRLEADIRGGIARGEFVLHYQPIVDLQARLVTGVEALVRWNHPNGMRMPDEFIPVAERCGLIVPLGAWVLGEACRQAAAWAAEGMDLMMAVNLSVRQVADPGLLLVVTSALDRTKLPAERLLLEITESALIDDAELALATLQSLHALGAGIAIDDFGTGYSSLLYVKRYPVHTLKIDRSFVAGLGVDANDDAIVASVVSLAKGVNAVCTAEGVETPAQAELLRRLGCRLAQGYLFARPVPADDLPGVMTQCQEALRLPVLVQGRGRGRAARASYAVLPAVAQRMEDLHQHGASLHSIAAALNYESSRGPDGVRWTSTTVSSVLAAHAAQPQNGSTDHVAVGGPA